MNTNFKKSIILFCFFFVAVVAAHAQQKHFIYLQSDNNQPFYVRLDKKILSSSVSGYLIIPKLQDGNYDLAIGFPKNEWPEQNITCTINAKDVGYALKNFGEKGWGLFNLQTMQVVMSGTHTNDSNAADANDKKDVFSSTLSTVVNDPSLTNKTTAKPNAAVIVKEEIAQSTLPITKILSNNIAGGMEMIYVDETNGMKDTIRVFIAAEKNNITPTASTPKTEPVIEKPQQNVAKNNDPKFIDITLPNPNANAATEKKEEIKSAAQNLKSNTDKPILANSDCKSFATEDDFLKLRKKMAAENTDDAMVDVAKKTLKIKCFTTLQIQNLSVLFLKDKGKYNFFDATYPFVSDANNFSGLQAQLTDAYFIARFKAMLR